MEKDVPQITFLSDGTLSIQDVALTMAAARVGLAVAYESVDGPLLGVVTDTVLRDISTNGRTVMRKSDIRDDFVITEDGQRLLLDYVGNASFVLFRQQQRVVGVVELERTSLNGRHSRPPPITPHHPRHEAAHATVKDQSEPSPAAMVPSDYDL
eukprot:6192447-Pleurochrysis_carterae.AAC.3